jgi:hypothetical protein
MQSFESLIKEIEKNRTIAETPIPEDADPRTLTTRIGHQKRAKQNLQDLFLDYRKHVAQNAVFILTSGKQDKSFIDLATEEYGCFEVSADEVYEKIADGINPRNYMNSSATPGLFDMLMSVFNDICDEVGIIGYPAVLFESKYKRQLNSREDFVMLVKEAFNDKVGSDLVGLYAINKVAGKAVNEGYSGTTIPVIIHTQDKELTTELESTLKKVSPNVFKVSTTKKATAKSVEEKLVKIREGLKK